MLRLLAVCLVVLTASARAQDAEVIFHKAYFLEVEERNLEKAVALYEEGQFDGL